MPEHETEQKENQAVLYRSVWNKEDIERLPSIYANQLWITQSGLEFYLVFGEIFPPVLLPGDKLPPEEERLITVKPVAKIAISKEAMDDIGAVIVKSWQQFQERK